MKKRMTMFLLSFVLMAGMGFSQLAVVAGAEEMGTEGLFENIDYAKAPYVRVILEGDQIAFDVDPQIIQSRTMVPMRTIFESMGLEVSWDEATKTALGIATDTAISFTIGSDKAMVNGQESQLDVPALIFSNRTMIPLRFLSENMGYKVVWVQDSHLVLLSKEDIVEWRYDGFEEFEPYKEWEAKYINGVKTEEQRYNGLNHKVEIVNLYSADGRVIPNVPDFKIPFYGTGWFKTSPYVGKTYWVDLDSISSSYGNSEIFDVVELNPIKVDMLRDATAAANYVKVRIEDHGFNLETWKEIAGTTDSPLSGVGEEASLNGQIISSSDTIFTVIINDSLSGFMRTEAFLDQLAKPEADSIYNILTKDPKLMFPWEESIWVQLRGETPWAGMSKDMFLVQRQSKPDETAQIKTRFSQLDLWVYESEYADSIYYFSGDKLTGMW